MLQGIRSKAESLMSNANKASEDRKNVQLGVLREKFMTFYSNAEHLKSFSTLNHTGFFKICKKYAKKAILYKTDATTAVQEKFIESLERQPFNNNDTVKDLLREAERMFANVFAGGELSAAKAKLRVVRLHARTADILRVGMYCGWICALLAIVVILLLNLNPSPDYQATKFFATFTVYRALGLPLLMIWFWGVNVWIWARYRINYVFIFGFDPGARQTHLKIFADVGLLSALYLSFVFLFILVTRFDVDLFNIDPEYSTLAMVIFLFAVICNPFDRYFSARFLIVRSIGRILCSPFTTVKFLDFYIADVSTSMVRALFDIEYTVCYYVTGDWLTAEPTTCTGVNTYSMPILSIIPLFYRLLQCLRRYWDTKDAFPHLFNGFKYGLGLTVVFLGALNQNFTDADLREYRIFWLVAYLCSTTYSIYWDVYQDWGLGDRSARNWFLRDKLIFPPAAYYYVIFSNMILRFGWALSITPSLAVSLGFAPFSFVTLISLLELFRRAQWSVFRLEKEYLSNEEHYRSIEAVPLLQDPSVLVREQKNEEIPSNFSLDASASPGSSLATKRSSAACLLPNPTPSSRSAEQIPLTGSISS
eukprot:gnl/Hemi2/20436_TR6785_c0_g3_i1.p1 gnl/Hemi2/20436_TR6785_c0_g3~~gnl/Hemi2/20436_TR6785_c0_g3_i1.p1  ORF type:complete len:591 (+),score=178.57 gnl/Hemi2/20436_TR6785_c0_g3_i1:510-2282(+)